VLKEIEDSQGKIILFIDELHTLVGAGASEGAIDASNMLKPRLPAERLRAIGGPRSRISQVHRKRRRPRTPFRSFLWASRMSKTRCDSARLKESTKSITASASRLGHRRRGHSVASLFPTAFCRQGHRPDRRSCIVAAYSDRFHATEIDQLERRATQLEIENRPSKRRRRDSKEASSCRKELAGIREQSNAPTKWKQEKT